MIAAGHDRSRVGFACGKLSACGGPDGQWPPLRRGYGGPGSPSPAGGKQYESAVGTSRARPVCAANNRMRQQTIRAAYTESFSMIAAGLDLPAANCPPAADRVANGRPYDGGGAGEGGPGSPAPTAERYRSCHCEGRNGPWQSVPISNVFKWQLENTEILNSQFACAGGGRRLISAPTADAGGADVASNTHEGHRCSPLRAVLNSEP